MKEILQTCRGFANLAGLIQQMFLNPPLHPHGLASPWLLWRAPGLGGGKEIKVSMSNLLGRFFARAYLQHHHGINWFHPISRNGEIVRGLFSVRRVGAGDLADWFCTDHSSLRPVSNIFICESKGAHKANRCGNVLNPPDVINSAIRQMSNTEVYYLSPGGSILRSVKGWAVLSKWGTTHRGHGAFLHVVDPYTKGSEELSPEENTLFGRSIAQSHVGTLLEGLGFDRLGTEVSSSQRARGLDLSGLVTVRLRRRSDGVRYLGNIFSLNGPLEGDLGKNLMQIKKLPADLRRQFIFLGIGVPPIEDSMMQKNVRIQDTQIAQSIKSDNEPEFILDPDGFIVADVSEISID